MNTPLASTWWNSPPSWWNPKPPRHGIQQLHTHEVLTPLVCTVSVIASSIEVAASWDFSCVCGLPLCWCWQFSSSKGKPFCLAAFLPKKRFRGGKLLLIFSQESLPKKSFCLRMMKSSASLLLGSSGGSLVATSECKHAVPGSIRQFPQPTVDCQSLRGAEERNTKRGLWSIKKRKKRNRQHQDEGKPHT